VPRAQKAWRKKYKGEKWAVVVDLKNIEGK